MQCNAHVVFSTQRSLCTKPHTLSTFRASSTAAAVNLCCITRTCACTGPRTCTELLACHGTRRAPLLKNRNNSVVSVQRTREKEEARANATAVAESPASAEEDDDVVDPVITDRMLSRVFTFAGLPVLFGLALYPLFWYLKVRGQSACGTATQRCIPLLAMRVKSHDACHLRIEVHRSAGCMLRALFVTRACAVAKRPLKAQQHARLQLQRDAWLLCRW